MNFDTYVSELLSKYGLDARTIADSVLDLVQCGKLKQLNYKNNITRGEYKN